MEDDSDSKKMRSNALSAHPELVNEQKEKYVFCSNISRWVSNMNETLSRSPLSACGIVSYKLVGKYHLPSSSFHFFELLRDEDARRIINAPEEPGINKNEKEEKSDTEEREITGLSPIHKLNVDCLIEIFSYLPLEKRLEIENVCVHWRDVSKKAWSNIRELRVTSFLPSAFTDHFARSEFIEKLLMRCGVHLNTLELLYVCSSHILQVIGKYCHNLKIIKLSFTKSYPEHFEVLSKMKKLQSFQTYVFEKECLINCLLNLPKTIKSIDVPDVEFCSNSRSSLTNILEKFTELESLRMGSFCYEKDLMKVISRKKTIIEFCTGWIDFTIDLKLLANLSNLERLELEFVESVDDHFLKYISTKCRKLKYLDISYCENLSDAGLRELKNLDALEVLFMSGMTERITDLLLSQLRGIKKLRCDVSRVTDEGAMQLIKNNPDLEELNLHNTLISTETLRFAIQATKDRKNAVVLFLFADLEDLKFDLESEDYSPFIKIDELFEEGFCERTVIDYLIYEKNDLFATKVY